eukprot:1005415-Prorocentrum_minimum.AAC.1
MAEGPDAAAGVVLHRPLLQLHANAVLPRRSNRGPDNGSVGTVHSPRHVEHRLHGDDDVATSAWLTDVTLLI